MRILKRTLAKVKIQLVSKYSVCLYSNSKLKLIKNKWTNMLMHTYLLLDGLANIYNLAGQTINKLSWKQQSYSEGKYEVSLKIFS